MSAAPCPKWPEISRSGIAPGPGEPGPKSEPEFLPTLVASGGDGRRRRSSLVVSALVHAASLVAALLVPLLVAEKLPVTQGGLRVFIFEPIPPPPAPPPPPLPLGSGLVTKRTKPTPPTPELPREKPALVAPALETSPATTLANREGDPGGSVFGVPEGVEGGVEGGVVGGIPGGVVGGVLGGVPGPGPIPVMDYDRPPRPLRMPRPEYPNEAFVKKVEGTVVVQIVIDEHGRVAEARIVRSIPMLDEAALRAVRSWAFIPALRGGQPVASIAMAPVTFRIY